jgi:hypothetical protein
VIETQVTMFGANLRQSLTMVHGRVQHSSLLLVSNGWHSAKRFSDRKVHENLTNGHQAVPSLAGLDCRFEAPGVDELTHAALPEFATMSSEIRDEPWRASQTRERPTFAPNPTIRLSDERSLPAFPTSH